jgi:3-oxoacyl-[acyl-carrier protein] reductase
MKLLEGKKVIVTGGSRGIGKGIVKKMAENGADVAFTYRSSADQAKILEKELQEMGILARAYQSDAADYDQSQQLIQQVLKDFGRVDILINNAGITKDNLLLRMSEEDFDQVVRINLKSVFNMTKAVIRPMMKQRSGSIINISSIVGIRGNAGQANYAASKAGIIGFTKSVAQEMGGRNIRCNVVAPGFIETEMTAALDNKVLEDWKKQIPLKRTGKPEDVANACVFLASPLSDYITGQVLVVDGGMLM